MVYQVFVAYPFVHHVLYMKLDDSQARSIVRPASPARGRSESMRLQAEIEGG